MIDHDNLLRDNGGTCTWTMLVRPFPQDTQFITLHRWAQSCRKLFWLSSAPLDYLLVPPSPTTRTLCSALRHRLRPITTSLIHQKITPIWCESPRPHPSKFSAPHVAGRMTFLKSVISTTKGPSHLAAATTISESAQLPISPIPTPSPTPTIP